MANVDEIISCLCDDLGREHKCFRCNEIYNCLDPYGTTVDENDCKYAYENGVEKIDNGGGYWIIACPHYAQIDTRPLYKTYMNSDEWRKKARMLIEKAGYKCKLCGSAINICVHHITYDHLFQEESYPDDVVVVCKKCHEKLHESDLKNKEGEMQQ